MDGSCNVYALIKSLNRSEKGYFKKHATFHIRTKKGSNYVKIFDAMDAQKVYNEPKLIKKFRHERFVHQLPVAKNYLYNIILESLEAYHHSSVMELRSLMNKAEILTDRGLYLSAKKILKKAKGMAVEYKKLNYTAEISLMEQSIHRLEYDIKALKQGIENIPKEIKLSNVKITLMYSFPKK